MASIVSRRQVVAISDQPDMHGVIQADEATLPGFQRFLATGGSTTTIACTALLGATADVYVGHFVKCVGPRTSLNYGLKRRVTAFNAATDTLTTETSDPWPTAVVASDQFQGYKCPWSFWCEDTGGGANTDINDASRDEGTNYWDDIYGDYAIAVAGTITENTLRLVSSFTTVGGILATAAQPAIPAIGDLFDVASFPEILGNVVFTTSQQDIERPVQLGGSEAFDREPNARGSQMWSCSIPLELKGSGTGGARSYDDARILQAFFTEIIGLLNTSATAGGTTSTLKITNTHAPNWPVGTPVLFQGRLVTTTSTGAGGGGDDDLNVNPQVTRVPNVGETIFYGASYYPKLNAHRALSFFEWDGEFKSSYVGGFLQNLKLSDFTRDRVPRLTFDFQGGPWLRARNTAIPDPTRPHVPATAVTNAYITLGASTQLLLISLDVDWHFTVRMEPIANGYLDGYYGYVLTDWAPVITCRAKYDGRSPQNTQRELERYMSGETFSFQAQHDERVGFTTGIYAHVCEWMSPTISAANDLREITITARPLRSNLTSMPKMLLQRA